MKFTVWWGFPCYSKPIAYKHLTGVNGHSESLKGSRGGGQLSPYSEQTPPAQNKKNTLKPHCPFFLLCG